MFKRPRCSFARATIQNAFPYMHTHDAKIDKDKPFYFAEIFCKGE